MLRSLDMVSCLNTFIRQECSSGKNASCSLGASRAHIEIHFMQCS